jgi:hypothetical protein
MPRRSITGAARSAPGASRGRARRAWTVGGRHEPQKPGRGSGQRAGDGSSREQPAAEGSSRPGMGQPARKVGGTDAGRSILK